jgi:hypothetical protein
MLSDHSTTANAVSSDSKADSFGSSPVGDEKHKSTTRTDSSSPGSEVAPALGVGGVVGEPDGSAQSSASPSKNPQSLGTTHTESQDNEKATHVVKENGSVGTNEPIVKNERENGVEAGEEGDEIELVYPGGLQLGLLTFGLCMATFTVALGEWFLLHQYKDTGISFLSHMEVLIHCYFRYCKFELTNI